MREPTDMKSYSIGSLLFLVTLLALIFSWIKDHADLKSRIQMLNSVYGISTVEPCVLQIGDYIYRADNDSQKIEEKNEYWLWTTVSSERLEACTDWNSNQPNPPVSASAAIKLADATIPTLAFPGPSGIWQRQTVTLTPINKHWCWIVRYQAAENSALSGGFSIVVLMDGSVLKPYHVTSSPRFEY